MLTPKERMLKRLGIEEMPKDSKERAEMIRNAYHEHYIEKCKKCEMREKMRNKLNNTTE